MNVTFYVCLVLIKPLNVCMYVCECVCKCVHECVREREGESKREREREREKESERENNLFFDVTKYVGWIGGRQSWPILSWPTE